MSRLRALLLDIEGTTTPISFVSDVLFPYAQRQYRPFISSQWSSSAFAPYKQAFEPDGVTQAPEDLISFVEAKHAANEKHTAFKALQGHLWESGYASGELQSTVYPDVVAAIRGLASRSDSSGGPVQTYIYSSGSIPAQKLLFGHVGDGIGDLTPELSGYFDTSTAGAKVNATSYQTIATQTNIQPDCWLFLSDNPKEVTAAKQAGMHRWIVRRPGNAPLTAQDLEAHKVVDDFTSVPAFFNV
ncbi:enolase-phosphatase E1 [Savitreella phatthalungensis]